MATLADYLVIQDGSLDINAGDSWTSDSFPIPADRVGGTFRAKAILQYKVRPLTHPPFSGQTDLTIKVNGSTIVDTIRVDLDTVRGLWEAFSATILNADSSANFLEVRADRGPVRISDVVLWFQRDIETD